jgi:isoleucyl-tRNA synthetase
VPIPVFYDEATGEVLLNADTINHVQAIIAEKGSDAWWELSVEELLPEQYCQNGKTYRRGTDTMDDWFDSGSSFNGVLAENKVADLYCEGVDQFSGWFQSSLLLSIAYKNQAPYKNILVHG